RFTGLLSTSRSVRVPKFVLASDCRTKVSAVMTPVGAASENVAKRETTLSATPKTTRPRADDLIVPPRRRTLAPFAWCCQHKSERRDVLECPYQSVVHFLVWSSMRE